MIGIPLTSTADTFAAPPSGAEFDFGGTGYSYGSFLVYNASVQISIKHGTGQGSEAWGPEFTVGPSVLSINAGGPTGWRPHGSELIYGIRARSLLSGTPAVVVGSFFQPGEVSLSATAATASSITSGGTVNPCPCGSTEGETFEEGMLAIGLTSNLLGWWRLGDLASPFLDSNPYLTPKNAVKVENGLDYTTHVAGCLGGTQDDGALLFNGKGTGTPGDLIQAPDTRFDLSASDMSFAFWIKPTLTGSIFSAGVGGALGGGAISLTGWGFTLDYPGMTLTWQRRQDGGLADTVSTTIAAGACYFVVATYSTTTGSKLYVNGALQATSATTFALPTPHFGVFMGGIGTILGTYTSLFGALDEVSVWGAVLSPADILRLYQDGIRVTV